MYIFTVIKIDISFGTRKIQKNGYTYLLPLPAAWAKNFSLQQGSQMRIEMMNDFSLRITPVPMASYDEGTRRTTPSAENGDAGNENNGLNR